MTGRRVVSSAAAIVGALSLLLLSAGSRIGAAETAPARLTDQEFWSLVNELSEPNGSFRSDNLLSNEIEFQQVIPELLRVAKQGRAYLGVGPEQNFTYIASLRPSIAFIVDIRRGNLDLHLLYKALFELADTRSDFVGLLFSRPRPPGLTARSSAKEIFDAFAAVPSSERLYRENMARVRDRLLTGHGIDLPEDDVSGIDYVYRAFLEFGPAIQYSPQGLTASTVQPTYAALMAATDKRGQPLGFLASEERFSFVKGLESRNLVVPVVGNFAGTKALVGVADYLKRRQTMVSAFYLSNVEEYLRRDGIWRDFCANVSNFPRDATSTFIRSVRASGDPLDGMVSQLGPMSEITNCR